MFTITEVTKNEPELQQLISELDTFQSALYPAESNHCIDISTQQDDSIRCLLVRDNTGQAVGCGAVLLQDHHAGEIKRVFVKPSCRGMQLGKVRFNRQL
ncbi:GNAT family N-acetyltransferase [Erwinia sp. V71]|uniref:GNAT family N-acetyltransferase n=1 Tax=Erwinia sp. V71 TaxID=3369424 RepID=UPI003F5D84F4